MHKYVKETHLAEAQSGRRAFHAAAAAAAAAAVQQVLPVSYSSIWSGLLLSSLAFHSGLNFITPASSLHNGFSLAETEILSNIM